LNIVPGCARVRLLEISQALGTLSDRDLQLVLVAAESAQRGAEFEVTPQTAATIERYQAALVIEQRKLGMESVTSQLESQKTTGHMDRTSVDRALFELEKARMHYRQSRDALASAPLPDRSSEFAEVQPLTRPPDDNQRVREIAQLLWEFEARREGFADDDWYRAEEIIRSARAADAQPASRPSLS
jgi:Protein of unknown function (DUF2934)